MTLDQFKILHKKYSVLPLAKEVWDTPEYEVYINALHENKSFQEWTLKEKFSQSEFDYSEFCCLIMADKIWESIDKNGEIKHGNVDVIMRKWNDGTYGIPIHDGGSSIIEIEFCPWCGTELKKASC
ncbi:MAG: hypothetical protein HKP06_06065 [Flavobacteriaceae bacterium]|nr:hypothetical protein [Flavobacteriaceae bacterium]